MPKSWAQLFGWYVRFRPILTLGLLLAILFSAAVEILYPWLLQLGIDAIVGERAEWPLEWVAGAMVATIVLMVIGHAVALLIEAWLFSAASYQLRRSLYIRFHTMPLAQLARYRSGALSYRATSDVNSFEAGIKELFGDFSFDLLVGLGVIIIMGLTDVEMTALVIAILSLATVISGYFGQSLPIFQRATQMFAARLAGVLQESLGAARTVRAFKAEDHAVARLDTINRKMMRMGIYGGIRRAAVTPLWHFAETLGIVVVLWHGGNMVLDKQITIGTLVAFIAYMDLLAGPMTRIGGYYYQFQSCRGIAIRIAELLSSPQEALSGTTRGTKDNALALENLSFGYPGSNRIALANLSFAIEEGARVALIGRNGSGKSTLFDLLMRFYEPAEGRILVGGEDLRSWDVAAWRGVIGLMLQETVLLHGTLADNVAIGKPEATQEQVLRALTEAGAGPLLGRLPRGLDTVVGERGAGLSGGERQLIGLARLFLHDPRIVLLDEPTSQLDGDALRTVMMGLDRLMQGRTTLLITHNPAVMQLAAHRVLLDGGRLIAQGSHQALWDSQPLYRSLVGAMEE
ncbi:MAG: ABC transporter ATP-binding protein [Methylococcaceae bacterium]|nr:ABC transporter ATP-binding protein [Methylococcaceae bacterium]